MFHCPGRADADAVTAGYAALLAWNARHAARRFLYELAFRADIHARSAALAAVG